MGPWLGFIKGRAAETGMSLLSQGIYTGSLSFLYMLSPLTECRRLEDLRDAGIARRNRSGCLINQMENTISCQLGNSLLVYDTNKNLNILYVDPINHFPGSLERSNFLSCFKKENEYCYSAGMGWPQRRRCSEMGLGVIHEDANLNHGWGRRWTGC